MDANVSQFIAVTGASTEVARGLLEACGGNLDLAINMHLESGGLAAPTDIGASAGPSTRAVVTDDVLSPKSYEKVHGVRAPIPQTRGVLVEDVIPPRRALRSRRLPQTVFDPFQDYSVGSSRKLPGPGNDAKKKKSLSELFKPPHDIMFHGSFHEARQAGEHKQRWLLVNVQDSKEFACQVLNRDVWSNHNVKDIVKEHFVFWQIHRITDDGVKFKQLYHIDKYPYIAVIDPRTGENMANWNSLAASEFTKVIQEFLASHCYDDGDHQLLNMDSNKSSVVELSEQSQLEAAIQESLLYSKSSSSKRTKYQLVFGDSDDEEIDTISLSSGTDNDTEEMDGGCTSVEFGSQGSTQSLSKSSKSEHLSVCNIKKKAADKSILQGGTAESQPEPEQSRRTRKRTSSQSSAQDELPRKILRFNATQGNNESLDQVGLQSVSSRKPECSATLKKKVANGIQVEESVTPSTTVETLLETGSIGKDEVSHILFRLPDGSRLHKMFVCSHPIKELFDFLQSQGLSMRDHEAVTHFPRRNISAIGPTVSFKSSGLYPRETIFIHTTE